MAGEIYLSNLSGQFDYQSILNKYQELKFQQVQLIQQKEQEIIKKESAFKAFANMLQTFRNDFDTAIDPAILDKKNISSSDESIAVATITDESKLQDATLDITVNQLAQNDIWLSISGVDDKESGGVATTDGTLQIKYAGSEVASIDYTTDDTLQDIVNKINSSQDKVRASIFYNGEQYKLLVRGVDTGANNTIELNETGSGDLLNQLKIGSGDDTTGTDSHVQAAQDAKISIYGESVTSATNTFSNVLEGLEITVKDVGEATISIASDKKSAQDAFEKMLSDYNSLVDYIKMATSSNGDLSGDITLHSIRSAIFSRLEPMMKRGLLEVDHTNGHLSLNSAKFNELYDNNKDELKNLQNELKSSLEPYLNALLDPSGIIDQKEKSYHRQIDRYEQEAQFISKRIQKELEIMKKQFVHLDAMMVQMNDIKMRLTAILPKQSQQ